MKWNKTKPDYLKGRGAQINTPNRFHEQVYDERPRDEEALKKGEAGPRTQYIKVYPKTILNEVKSPDIPLEYSMNPYQGCEHGCVYCYARNTHNYWGYSAGLDFEQKILVKKNAARLLEAQLRKPKWEARPVMLSGNTDCYQPIEKELEITREILDVFWKYRHPVGVITKNSLLLRDIDLLEKLASENLIRVALSITTLNEELRRFLEPRTASISSRFAAVEQLASRGIPVSVMMAPVIPGLNEHEILPLAEKAAAAGARAIHHTLVRLNGDIAILFEDWLRRNLPDRADKVLNKIRSCHDGQLGSSRFGDRMRGKGAYAEMIHRQFELARKRFFPDTEMPPFNLELHKGFKDGQLKLF